MKFSKSTSAFVFSTFVTNSAYAFSTTTTTTNTIISRRTNVPLSTSGTNTPVGRTYQPQRAYTSTAALYMANVLKLSDPQSQLLDQVDVFIFDCDGVIWRVRYQLK
jgi:hypothetical protein